MDPHTVKPHTLTSSPFWILRLELMMILCPLSKVTTSATQLGAHEWLMYLQTTVSENYASTRRSFKNVQLREKTFPNYTPSCSSTEQEQIEF